MISGAFKRLCGFLARHEQFPTVLISFRYISDTFGYDRCCHVSTTDNDLWVPDSRFGVYSVIGQAEDDLPCFSSATEGTALGVIWRV